MKKIIWTKHASLRLAERKLDKSSVLETLNYPDTIKVNSNDDTTEFRKKIKKSRVTVIVKTNENNEWVILSAWIDPPLFGTKDYEKRLKYQKFQKASFWGKLWLTAKSQLGF